MAGKFMDDEEMKGMSFGHAGTIVEGIEDTATEKIARLEAAGIRVVERIDEIPDAVKEKLGAPPMGETLNKVFIDVEVDASVAGDAELAAKLEEVCPVDIFKAPTPASRSSSENLDECVLCRLCIEAAPAGRGARQEALRRAPSSPSPRACTTHSVADDEAERRDRSAARPAGGLL